jgi:hypothetical protein
LKNKKFRFDQVALALAQGTVVLIHNASIIKKSSDCWVVLNDATYNVFASLCSLLEKQNS